MANDATPWEGTELRCDISAAGTGVDVALDHVGWKQAPPEEVSQGWDHFINSLKSYVESGRGEPW